jgi:hypothetical protein
MVNGIPGGPNTERQGPVTGFVWVFTVFLWWFACHLMGPGIRWVAVRGGI